MPAPHNPHRVRARAWKRSALAAWLAVVVLGAPRPVAAQHANTTVASVRAGAGFVAFPVLGEVDLTVEAVAGANFPIWSVDEPAPREGWGMSVEGGVLINAGDQLGLVVHGIVTVGFDLQLELFGVGPIVSAYVGWGPGELSAGGRLGVRGEALFGIFGVDIAVDGRGYDGRALFGPDVRFSLDLGAAIHLLVGLTREGRPPPPPPSAHARARQDARGEPRCESPATMKAR